MAVIPTTQAAAQPAPGAVAQTLEVGTITLSAEDVPVTLNLSGVAVASESAQIRPLVQGIVQEIRYSPDQQMAPGDEMFQIDPTSYEAALASAEANLQSAEAARDEAQSNADRYEALAGRGVSEAEAESARSALLQAEAAVAVAQASLRTAQFDLNNTTITSPIEGQASVSEVSVGDLVTSGQSDELATVTRLDPIYADLADTSARMLRLRSMFEAGTVQPGDSLGVALILENGQTVGGSGEVISVGDQVSTSTGTFNVRVQIANPRRLILPGMFVSARLTIGEHQAMLIPQVAASPQADGTLSVYLVEDGKAVERAVQPTGSTDSAWIVPEGLADGDQLIVDNRDNLRDGMGVTAVASTVGTGGVVSDAGEQGEAVSEETGSEAGASDPASAEAGQ
ncbi:efflux RND transporter periplasmic adaptor subunit [Paracoccus albus]|uniref:efflux RND transporter periplasmic adaptor subunit n=1 Tax=Paracoccus albus TaxID=3017784 RepID=UPI0022F05402|nr:efflux RND transporter periplasmic adaptor subunit [Paracoccus albus]WBU61052.1 efflux RND transporter periplasmic adaptor subunit [Paracoccus albus]